MPGTSFDRVADIYDETRGGQRRGDSFAGSIAPWVTGRRVVELGVGTGVIAAGLRPHGWDPVGFDLSLPMMRTAVDRLGRRVAAADVDRLPLSDSCVDTTIFVWVLQLVADPITTLREATRITRPGGRVISILASADNHPDDEVGNILSGLAPLKKSRYGKDPLVTDAPASLRLTHDGFTAWDEFPASPADQIGTIERREYAILFDVDDSTWAAIVEPVLARLRALRDLDRNRTRKNRHPLIVWEAT